MQCIVLTDDKDIFIGMIYCIKETLYYYEEDSLTIRVCSVFSTSGRPLLTDKLLVPGAVLRGLCCWQGEGRGQPPHQCIKHWDIIAVCLP